MYIIAKSEAEECDNKNKCSWAFFFKYVIPIIWVWEEGINTNVHYIQLLLIYLKYIKYGIKLLFCNYYEEMCLLKK